MNWPTMNNSTSGERPVLSQGSRALEVGPLKASKDEREKGEVTILTGPPSNTPIIVHFALHTVTGHLMGLQTERMKSGGR